MLSRLRSLAALLLIAPVQAQVLPTKGVPAVSLAAPAPVLAPAVAPAFLTPSIISAPSAAASLMSPPAAPIAAAAAMRARHSRPIAAKPGRATRALEQPATPPDGWASRFDFELGRKVFDGDRTVKSDSGAVFVAVPKPDGKVRIHIVERAPPAALRPIAGTEGLSGRELLEKVASVAASGHKVRTYADASLALFSKADNVVIDGVPGVVDAYSGIFVPGTSGRGPDYPEPGDANDDGHGDHAGMNVEHTWPQSLFERALPMRSDLHHLMATFAHPNSIRANLPFGVVTGKPDYENKAGAKRGKDVNGRDVFEPPKEVKGRVARGLIYFYARYKNTPKFGRAGAAFWNQQIDLMLRWNREYPPDSFEARRNDFLESYQGNRNPLIDDAGLADRIGADALRAGSPKRAVAPSPSRRPPFVRPAKRRPLENPRAKQRPVQSQSIVIWRSFRAFIGPLTTSPDGTVNVNVRITYRGVRYDNPMALMSTVIRYGDQKALREFRARLDTAVNSYRRTIQAPTP